MNETATLLYIKRLIGLPFLPAQHIPAVFHDLAQDAGSEPLCRIVQYVRQTRLKTSIWPLQHGACSPSTYVPTTYVLLHAGAAASRRSQIVHHRGSSDQRKVAPETPEEDAHPSPTKIFQLWQEYEDGHKSAQQPLTGCAEVYGPVV